MAQWVSRGLRLAVPSQFDKDMVADREQQVAKRFARAYPVVLLARREESFKDLVTEINSSGGRAIGIPTDATDATSVKSAFDTIKKELPDLKLAAAVYNVSAGFGIKPFLEFKIDDLDSSLKGNA